MSPALRDILEQMGTKPPAESLGMLESLLKFSLVRGVKIGGIYRHFKGKDYIVTDVVHDADDWESYKVVYHEVADTNHRAARRVSSFLEDVKDVGPRFRLVG